MVEHKFEETETGVPQGGPLSPLLSNIMLNELDKELERRGHKFVWYADDMMIFCKSHKCAKRTLENILPAIENKLFLKVNREKTVIDYVWKIRFHHRKGTTRVRLHPKSAMKMKNKVKEITSRSNRMSNKTRIE